VNPVRNLHRDEESLATDAGHGRGRSGGDEIGGNRGPGELSRRFHTEGKQRRAAVGCRRPESQRDACPFLGGSMRARR